MSHLYTSSFHTIQCKVSSNLILTPLKNHNRLWKLSFGIFEIKGILLQKKYHYIFLGIW